MKPKKTIEKQLFKVENIDFGRTETGTPKVEECIGKEPYIKFGILNDYPFETIRLANNSSGLHSALLSKKAAMVASLGFEENLQAKSFIENKYGKENLNIVAYKCGYDLVTHGGFYLNVIWNRTGDGIAKLHHIPFEKVRCGKPTREDGEVSTYFISMDWMKCKKPAYAPYPICAFDLEDESLRTDEETQSQLLAFKTYSLGMDYYPLSPTHSIQNELKLHYEMTNYHLRSTQQGYLPGVIVSIPYDATPQEREKTRQDIEVRSGTDEAGKTMIVYGLDKDSMPQFTILQPSTSDQKFKDLMQATQEAIYVGHEASNVIAGVAIAGKLANTAEVKEQYAMFQKNIIAPMQFEIEAVFNRLASINGITEPLRLKNYNTYISEIETPPTMTPTSVIGEQPSQQPEQPKED